MNIRLDSFILYIVKYFKNKDTIKAKDIKDKTRAKSMKELNSIDNGKNSELQAANSTQKKNSNYLCDAI